MVSGDVGPGGVLPRRDGCPGNRVRGHEPRMMVHPSTWTRTGPRGYLGDYQCPVCGRSWRTSWRLGPRTGDEPTLDDLVTL